jgi:hypothetical protein
MIWYTDKLFSQARPRQESPNRLIQQVLRKLRLGLAEEGLLRRRRASNLQIKTKPQMSIAMMLR